MYETIPEKEESKAPSIQKEDSPDEDYEDDDYEDDDF